MSTNASPPLVGVILGSDSDLQVMEGAFTVLESFGVPYEARILSAHRSPKETAFYGEEAAGRGLKVLIAGAGWAAHLAGVLASGTILPVIGIPIDSSPLKGVDALLATAQMPTGIPVATMAIGKGGAHNAAIFAIQMLALSDSGLAEKLRTYKKKIADDVVVKKNKVLDEYLANRP